MHIFAEQESFKKSNKSGRMQSIREQQQNNSARVRRRDRMKMKIGNSDSGTKFIEKGSMCLLVCVCSVPNDGF